MSHKGKQFNGKAQGIPFQNFLSKGSNAPNNLDPATLVLCGTHQSEVGNKATVP